MKILLSKKFRRLTLVAILGALPIVGCSSKPSHSQVTEAVTDKLQNRIPSSWDGDIAGGYDASITLVEVKEWGTFNKDRKYWPARIRVVGSAKFDNPLAKLSNPFKYKEGQVLQFDQVEDFMLYKDDYGKWRATTE